MSTDICMYVEVKNNNKWIPIKKENPHKSMLQWLIDNTSDEKEKEKYEIDLFNQPKESYDWIYEYGQDYDLFSVLANVRNYDGLEFISYPKGLPSNLSSTLYKIAMKQYHVSSDHSWLTYKELKKFNWSKLPKKTQWVDPNENTKDTSGLWNFKKEDYFVEVKNNRADTINYIFEELDSFSEKPEHIRIVFWFI